MSELADGLLVELQRTLVQGDIDEHVKPVRRRKAEAMIELAEEDDGL